jgi:hypothetical protein
MANKYVYINGTGDQCRWTLTNEPDLDEVERTLVEGIKAGQGEDLAVDVLIRGTRTRLHINPAGVSAWAVSKNSV